jgi:3-mercaptopyruvate sulfurtransferase SseA
MKTYFKQAVYILIISIIIGISFNYVRLNGIPILSRQIKGFSDNSQNDEYIIETIDLEIAKRFFDDNVLFVDARDGISFKTGHIAGAISSIPFISMVDKIFDNQEFNGPLVVYCDDDECGLSEDLAYQLQMEGFTKIYIFSGGWNHWLMAELPVEK